MHATMSIWLARELRYARFVLLVVAASHSELYPCGLFGEKIDVGLNGRHRDNC